MDSPQHAIPQLEIVCNAPITQLEILAINADLVLQISFLVLDVQVTQF